MRIQEVLDKDNAHDIWAILRYENIVAFDEIYDEIEQVSNHFSIDPDTVNSELFSELFHTINPFAIEITHRFSYGTHWYTKAVNILRYTGTY